MRCRRSLLVAARAGCSRLLCRLFLVVLLTLSLTAEVCAADANDEAEAMFRASGGITDLGVSIEAMRPGLVRAVLKATHDSPERVKVFVDIYVAETEAHLGELVAPLVNLYAANFTADELRAVRDFYEGPVGRKLVTKGQDLARLRAEILTDWFSGFTADVARKYEEAKHRPEFPP